MAGVEVGGGGGGGGRLLGLSWGGGGVATGEERTRAPDDAFF